MLSGDEAQWVLSGALVARLHGLAPTDHLPTTTALDELDAAHRTVELLYSLRGALGTQAQALCASLAAQTPSPSQLVLLHGDLHEGQFVVNGDEVGLVDFDRTRLGDPALDIANLRAHAVLADLRNPTTSGAILAAFDDGYRRTRNLPALDVQRWYDAAALARMAATPFRTLELDWPTMSERLLGRATAILDGGL